MSFDTFSAVRGSIAIVRIQLYLAAAVADRRHTVTRQITGQLRLEDRRPEGALRVLALTRLTGRRLAFVRLPALSIAYASGAVSLSSACEPHPAGAAPMNCRRRHAILASDGPALGRSRPLIHGQRRDDTDVIHAGFLRAGVVVHVLASGGT